MRGEMQLPSLPRLRAVGNRGSVVGLDIEPGAIHAAQVSVNGRLVVDRAAAAALEPGVVRDGEVTDPESLTAALRALFAEHKLDKHVRLGVANQRIVVRHLLLPPIEDAKELAVAVRFQAADELPMPLDQAVLDHVALGMVDTPDGPRMRVLVVAARRDMIDRLLAAVRAAGLRPEGIDLAGFAMVRALGGSSEQAVAHLAVGGVVNLAIARGGECVFTRVIGGGTEAMAVDLAERAAITVEQARDDLRAAGVSADADTEDADPDAGSHARTVLEDGIRRIAAEVRNSLDFHLGADLPLDADGGAPPTIERVLLTGSAIGVPGFAEALGRALGMPVEIADVETPDGVDPGRFAVAAGLAVSEARV